MINFERPANGNHYGMPLGGSAAALASLKLGSQLGRGRRDLGKLELD